MRALPINKFFRLLHVLDMEGLKTWPEAGIGLSKPG